MSTELRCPKCPEIVLRRPTSGTPVYRCYHCHGMWVSTGEAQALLDEGRLLDPHSMLPQKASGDHKTGLCPHGHGLLIRARVDVDDGFFIERCSSCKGLWFDAGEWEMLASSRLLHHLDDLWDARWQALQRRARTEREYEARMREAFGDALMDRVEALAEDLAGHPRRNELVAYLLDRVRG